MHNKALHIILGMLVSASSLAGLLLLLGDTPVQADRAAPLRVRPGGPGPSRQTITRAVTIVGPTAGDILTASHQPTYTVEIEVGGLPGPEVVSVSVSGGISYQQAVKPVVGPYEYDWGLPGEDYETHVLLARARYPLGEILVSDPVTTHVDTIPPQGTTLILPDRATTTGFPVSWSALDGSDMIRYEVAYKRDDAASWTDWVADSAETSRLFTATVQEGHAYDFRMQARDKGGNRSEWIEETVHVGRLHVYLALTLREWTSWHQYDVYEPNDTPEEAWGPLAPGTVYQAYIWNATDDDDYYHFTPLTMDEVQITLTNIPATADYDLYVYYHNLVDDEYVFVAGSDNQGHADESVLFRPTPARKHYVRVYPYVGFSSQQPYYLELTYGAGD